MYQDIRLDNFSEVDQLHDNTMISYLDMRIMHVEGRRLHASMPLNEKTIQPYGILHGGASAAFAETIGSVAANFVLADRSIVAVGLNLDVKHVKKVCYSPSEPDKRITGIGAPLHLGKRTQVWEIKLYDPQ